ncbi:MULTISPECIES: 50S ribosomal protein L5 [unclassified Thermoplasma]|uniref:50S ribosomal protein L5 n=1 Tax=unclassified Thermoplasma TaxID=2684908 RepID=UPI000D849E6F|nr:MULTISPECIES: 50S ribosomal protein L5 [unclassified Thermoplasma]PYB67709.1 50S ribosomal protein L5 [Thermoplasma sp. Kam2015]
MNPMEEIIIDKVVVNIGVGQAGDRLTKAAKVLEMLTGHKATNTLAKKSVRDFNIRKRLPIGVKVTLRKKDAMEFLNRAFYVKDYKITDYSFDKHGNAYFGISDYTDFKGMKYDPDIGIFGMDVAIVFKRRGGYRIERRRIAARTVPNSIRIKKEEAQEFLQKNFKVTVVR